MTNAKLITNLTEAIAALKLDLANLFDQAQDLQQQHPVNASPHWRRDDKGELRYLYLVYPTANGRRKREYIGVNVEKQRIALGQVQAHKELVVVQEKMANITRRLERVARLLEHAVGIARGNW